MQYPVGFTAVEKDALRRFVQLTLGDIMVLTGCLNGVSMLSLTHIR